MSILVSPSLLSADFLNLSSEIEMINRSQADFLHLDIMDGHFVPNITFGMFIVEQIKKAAAKPLDVHLMIDAPEKYIRSFCQSGADILTVHFEGNTHLHRMVKQIKENGVKAGVAINPHTNINLLYDILEELDLVLIMSVNPGFGGQKFIERTFEKIKTLKKEIDSRKLNILIEVDGGVDNTNAAKLALSGANILVAGNYVFKSADPELTIKGLKDISG